MAASLERSVYEVVEGVAVSVCVSLSNNIDRNVIIDLMTTLNGILTNPASSTSGKYFPARLFQSIYFFPTDFNPVDQSLTFKSSLNYCVQVMTIDDNVLEDRETVGIVLSSSDPDVAMDGLSSAIITILDNDSM